jgi:formate hydrogenlyase transcriptional activator
MSSADRREAIGTSVYWRRTWPRRYGLALIAVGAVTLSRYALSQLIGPNLPFILFYPAILLVTWMVGLGPAIFAVFLSAASASYLFSGSASPALGLTPNAKGLLLFSTAGVAISGVAHMYRLRAERLREFARAAASVDEGIIILDRRYRYVVANRVFLEYRGVPSEQLIGRSLAEIMGAEVFETTVKPKLDEAFQGKVVKFEKRYEYPTRGERDFAVSYFPIEGPTGIDRVACILQDITDQKRAERALKLFRTLVDQSNDAVEVVDPETLRFLDVNEKACKDLGYSREELLTMTVFDINPHIDESIRSKVIEKLHRSGFFVRVGVHRRKDGSTFPVETSMKFVQLDRSYVVSVSRDISDRRQAEEALRESEDRYRDLIEHSQDLVCTHDLEGNLLSVNPAPARLLGYDVAEFLKIPMRELIVPEYRGLFDEYLARIKVNGADKGLLCVMTRSGEQRIWEYNNTLRTEGVPSPIVRGMAHDVTDRRRAEEALRSSEQRYRLLFEKNVAGIAICSWDGTVMDCNQEWARVLGYGEVEDIRGRPASEFYFNPDDRQPLRGELKREGTLRSREVQLRRKNGTPVWVLFNTVMLAGDDGMPLVQATAIDISERKMAEEALRRNEERFRVALKDSPITVFNQDCDLRYTWIYNPQACCPENAVGKTDDEIMGAEKAARLNELKRRVLATGASLREEVVIPLGDRRAVFDLTIEPLLDADGSVIGITAAAMDIARLRERAEGLQEAQDKLLQEKSYLESEIQAELGFEEIIGQSPALREVLKKARVVAPTDSSVLLLGETGTGKELVARAVHALSARHAKSFIKLNCAAVPSGLLESELFGHEKGAFTGAVSQKLGRIELADKGTLFLDEIGELPIELQPKLLRVLQDREFERLGGVHTLHVDVRIISATNCDLQQDIADKKFREDLFYRLNVFPILLPALRERRSDIPILVCHFMRKHSARMGKHIEVIPDETMEILQNWIWPGNIRELENMIERMVIMTKGDTLAAPPVELEVPQELSEDNLTEMERDHIMRVLRETNGVLSGVDGAASRLGIKRTTLQSMLKRFGIEPRGYRRGTGTFGGE